MSARAIGPYSVVRELGRGGMGVVYEVRHPDLPRAVALKQVLASEVTPEALLRFAREGQLLAKVTHRGVVRVHHLDKTPQGPILVTELVEGRPLAALARAGLDPWEAARLVREVSDAVAALHAVGIVHRDLKGANIIVRPDGQPVVIDFGIGREVAQADERLTLTGEILGSPGHMAPEQAEGARSDRLGPAVDVWGLGALLHEALTGEAPFSGPTVTATLQQVLLEEPPAPSSRRPGVPRALDLVVRRALSKSPGARHPSAAALKDELDLLLRERASTGAGRGRAPLLLGGLLLLAAALAVAWAATRRPAPEEPPVPPPTTTTTTGPVVALPPRRGTVDALLALVGQDGVPGRVAGLKGERGAFTGDRLVTWSDGGTTLSVWEPDAKGALLAREVAAGGPIDRVAVDADPADGAAALVAVLLRRPERRVVCVDLDGGPLRPVSGEPPRLLALGLGPAPLLLLGDERGLRVADLEGGPARAVPLLVDFGALRALAASRSTVGALDGAGRVCAPAPGDASPPKMGGVDALHDVAVSGAKLFVADPTGGVAVLDSGLKVVGGLAMASRALEALAAAGKATLGLAGGELLFAGEEGRPWATRRSPGATGVALDGTGRAALVATPGGVEAWAVATPLRPFRAEASGGLRPAGVLPALERPPEKLATQVAWASPVDLVVSCPIDRDTGRLVRFWRVERGAARPTADRTVGHCPLLVVRGGVLVRVREEQREPWTTRVPALDQVLRVAADPAGHALVGLVATRVLLVEEERPDVPRAVGTIGEGDTTSSLAFAGGRVALGLTGVVHGVVRVWDGPGGADPRELRYFGVPIVALDPAGAQLAVGYPEALFVVDAATAQGDLTKEQALGVKGDEPNEATGVPQAHPGVIRGLTFLAGGRELLSLSSLVIEKEHELRRWRRADGGWELVGRATWSGGALRAGFALSPDGRWLALATTDGTTELFAVDPIP